MTITIKNKSGVVSVHSHLASYEKLSDYPIIKRDGDKYHKGSELRSKTWPHTCAEKVASTAPSHRTQVRTHEDRRLPCQTPLSKGPAAKPSLLCSVAPTTCPVDPERLQEAFGSSDLQDRQPHIG